MHIILVSDRMTAARNVELTWRHLLLAVSALCALIIGGAMLVSYLSVRHAAMMNLPILGKVVRAINAEETARSQTYMRENISTLAVKLGEMQAQLLRLDTIGERLAQSAGLKPQDMQPAAGSSGRGGPLVSPQPLTEAELEAMVESVGRQLEQRSDALALIESHLLAQRIRRAMLPTTLPVDANWNASTYGWRVDPFTGHRAMHEGVDFSASPGTPIFAAAAGVVINVERHPQYGNFVEIDHGNDVSTRYAHASVVDVKQGAVVKRGQKIAEVGSTGRSTGPHLHFEVRVSGAPQNPNRFLEDAAKLAHRH